MKRNHSILLLVGLLCACAPEIKVDDPAKVLSVVSPEGTHVYIDDWNNISKHYKCPEWFRDSKFGIFIHWGPYAIPAFGNEWYASQMYVKNSKEYKHHLETYGNLTEFGYKDFIPMFTADKFDAKDWVSLVKASGAKYIVPVAEHHDGFSMYDSDRNPWNSVDMGPKKDIIALLKKEADRQGIIFGLSSHRLENAWYFRGGLKTPSDVQDTTISLYGARLKGPEAYDDAVGFDWLAHVHELIDKYEPQLFYYDWTVNSPKIKPYFNKFLAYYYNNAIDWGKEVVVNAKEGYPNSVLVGDMERGKLKEIRKYPWQTDTSVGKISWGYIDGEENKTPGHIIHDLIDIVSKNGNLLLNIGPRADGSITEEQRAILLEIGEWLKINGEAIYGTRPWVKSGEGNAIEAVGTFTDNQETQYTAQDIRFTTKGNTLYAICMNWTEQNVLIHFLDPKGIGDSKIQSVSMLGTDDTITWEETEDGLRISFPEEQPCNHAYAFKIVFDKMAGSGLENEMIDVPMTRF